MPDLRQLIDLNYLSMTLVTVIVFFLVALGISCAFVIFILKHVREYAIVKAMGVTPVETILLIATEVILLNLVAACAGVLLGVAVVAIVGRSGSGKTTLLHCAGGLEPPDSGRVTCFGEEIHALSRRELALFLRRSVGFVFQLGNLLSYLTVAENIALPMALNGIPRRERRRRTAALLERVGLGERGPALPRELSGGEMQRISFARAVAHRPKMVLADEPTANLDSATGRDLMALMQEIVREQRCTLLVATHDPAVEAIADEVLRLHDGRVVHGEGSPGL